MRTLKKTIKYVLLLARYRALRKIPHPAKDNHEHLQATMEWLCVAQDANDNGGISANYDLWKQAWGLSYRETTGYIIETFLAYYHHTKNNTYLERAVRMGEWELEVQCEDGSVGEVKKDGTIGKKIFNTGQVMLGYLALYRETKEEKYLTATARAASWLIQNQAQDGSWPTYASRGEAQTIETRVAWPLLDFALLTHDEEAKAAAVRHLGWVMSMQRPNGWFDNTSFTKGVNPWTHQIAYTISGLLECYLLLGSTDTALFDAAYRPAVKLLELAEQKAPAFLGGSFDEHWRSTDTYSCLTGNAQLAIIWLQLYSLTKEERFKTAAHTILEQLKRIHLLGDDKKTHGALLGSYPFDGGYAPYTLPNWAPKFFADALMLQARTDATTN